MRLERLDGETDGSVHIEEGEDLEPRAARVDPLASRNDNLKQS
jgi:hypothetical protein